MRFVFLVAAYNEAAILPSLCEKFRDLENRKVDFEVCILDNASTDGTQELISEKLNEWTWLRYLRTEQKGLGAAFKTGMKHYAGKRDSVTSQSNTSQANTSQWFVFTAADLPFGFTDFDSFLKMQPVHLSAGLFVGSKQHPQSEVRRDFKRKFMSAVFLIIRKILLGLSTKDTQGTIFLREEFLNLYSKIQSSDYFFTTELIYLVSKNSAIIEMPVTYLPELRPSNVRIFADGYKSLKQLIKLKFRNY